MDDQQRMEAYLARTMIENNENQKDTVNGKMQSVNLGCSYEDRSITLGFPVLDWQANRRGMLHGGVFCIAFDMTLAALARFCAGESYAPTISLDVKYIRPVQLGDTMVVTAKALGLGKRIIQMTCEARSQNTGKLVATGASVYMSVDTTKEER